MQELLPILPAAAVGFGVLYGLAKFVKVCLDIYNGWPSKPRSRTCASRTSPLRPRH
jgi:hypothetical protein